MTVSLKEILIFHETVLIKQGYIFMYSMVATEVNNIGKTKTVDCENLSAFWK
jgi:hypothetical protein